MSLFDVLMLAYQVLVPVSIVLGLWIALRWMPDVNDWLVGIGAGAVAANRVAQLAVCIVLGVLFANPIMDLFRTLVTVIQRTLTSATTPGTLSTVWGPVPYSIYTDVSILMTCAIYVVVVWAGYRLWPEAAVEEAAEDTPDGTATSLATEEWFVLFAVASLVNRFILDILQSIVWLPVPSSIPMGPPSFFGVLGGWLVALAVLAIILVFLSNRLSKSPQAS